MEGSPSDPVVEGTVANPVALEGTLADLVSAVTALAEAVAGRAPSALSPGELAGVNETFGAVRRRLDAAYAPFAGEVARQSRRELGRDGFARKQGYRSPAALISATTGATVGDAARLMEVGEATAPRQALTGEVLPAKHPHVAAALRAGRIGLPAASAIIHLLDRVAVRADPAAVVVMEEHLASVVPGLRPDQVHKLLLRAEAYLDQDGVVPREAAQYASRSLTIREDPDGVIQFTGRFDAESGAPIKAAIEGMTTQALRRNERERDEALRDPRSVPQLQADALTELCRHGLSCTEVPTGPSTTVVVRIALTDLQAATGTDATIGTTGVIGTPRPGTGGMPHPGTGGDTHPGTGGGAYSGAGSSRGTGAGVGTIDGIGQPVSTSVVRRLAADAGIIPCVLGGDSEILDWGRHRRLFTLAQRLAILERDGGCAFCGAPPGQTVVHHLRWWARHGGTTDLDNAIALCTSCHHRIHDDGWETRIEGTGTTAVPWFIPPPWLDPIRTPRKGGRARYDLVA